MSPRESRYRRGIKDLALPPDTLPPTHVGPEAAPRFLAPDVPTTGPRPSDNARNSIEPGCAGAAVPSCPHVSPHTACTAARDDTEKRRTIAQGRPPIRPFRKVGDGSSHRIASSSFLDSSGDSPRRPIDRSQPIDPRIVCDPASRPHGEPDVVARKLAPHIGASPNRRSTPRRQKRLRNAILRDYRERIARRRRIRWTPNRNTAGRLSGLRGLHLDSSCR